MWCIVFFLMLLVSSHNHVRSMTSEARNNMLMKIKYEQKGIWNCLNAFVKLSEKYLFPLTIDK